MKTELAFITAAALILGTLVVSAVAQQQYPRATSAAAGQPQNSNELFPSSANTSLQRIGTAYGVTQAAQPNVFMQPAGQGGGDYRGAEEADAAREADQLTQELGRAKNDAERDKLKARLGELLDKQFNLRQARHEREIEALETRVKKLKDLVQKRQENRRDIVSRRLEQILRELDGLGW
jgi:hypothetical protein